ncbi:MAG: hypothetical protein QXI17_00610, partial [Candidatus Bilamarchaeaceae archaeon]
MFSPVFLASYEAFDFCVTRAKAYAHPNPEVFYRLFLFFYEAFDFCVTRAKAYAHPNPEVF